MSSVAPLAAIASAMARISSRVPTHANPLEPRASPAPSTRTRSRGVTLVMCPSFAARWRSPLLHSFVNEALARVEHRAADHHHAPGDLAVGWARHKAIHDAGGV